RQFVRRRTAGPRGARHGDHLVCGTALEAKPAHVDEDRERDNEREDDERGMARLGPLPSIALSRATSMPRAGSNEPACAGIGAPWQRPSSSSGSVFAMA